MGGRRANKGQTPPPPHRTQRHVAQSCSSSGSSSTLQMAYDDDLRPPTKIITSGYVNHVEESSSSSSSGPPIDLVQALREVEGSLIHTTWNEIFWVMLVIFSFAALSLFLGFAMGMTISVHYYDSRLSFPRLVARAESEFSGVGPRNYIYNHQRVHQRVTILDASIAMSNNFPRRGGGGGGGGVGAGSEDGDRDMLRRVMEVSPQGQRKLVHILEENDMELLPQHLVDVHGNMMNETDPGYMGGGSEGKNICIEQAATCSFATTTKDTTWAKLPTLSYDEWATVRPKLCADGITYGFDDYQTLREAVLELNHLSAEKFLRWNAFYASVDDLNFKGVFQDSDLYYDETISITICPGKVLKATGPPLYVNSESVILECRDCMIQGKQVHMTFGSSAKNVVVRGLTFSQGTPSSVTFPYSGAEISFEDCTWDVRWPIPKFSQFGSVVDINSTSYMNCFRCRTTNTLKAPLQKSSLAITLRTNKKPDD